MGTVIRCAIEKRYFAPPRGLQAVAPARAEVVIAALGHLHAIAHQATHLMTRSPVMAARRAESFRGHRQKTPRPIPGEASANSLTVAAVGAGPDKAVALAFLVGEEVGVDRSGEARIVELEP